MKGELCQVSVFKDSQFFCYNDDSSLKDGCSVWPCNLYLAFRIWSGLEDLPFLSYLKIWPNKGDSLYFPSVPFSFKGISFFHESNLGPQTLTTSSFSAFTSSGIEHCWIQSASQHLRLRNYIFSRRVYLLSTLGSYIYPDLLSTVPYNCGCSHHLSWA